MASLGSRQAWRRRLRAAGEGGESEGEGEGDQGLDDGALSAVENLMKSERGERLSKAMRDVIELRAAKDAVEKGSSPQVEAERKRVDRMKAETLEELQGRLEDVERAKRDLDSVSEQQGELRAMLEENAERAESLKCAVAGAAAGGLFSLPLFLASDFDILSLGSCVASSALFALTYRYAVTNDVANTQLKQGVVLAFGLTRGLAVVGDGGSGNGGGARPIGEVLGSALTYQNFAHCAQSLLLFAFVSAALELGFRRGALKLFGRGG